MHSRPSTPRSRGAARIHSPSTSKRGHRRSQSLNVAALALSPASLARISSSPFDLDILIEKAKGKLNTHQEDFDALIHATEQICTAQRLNNLGHKVMIETLRSLSSSSILKKKGNELADLLHSLYLKETERTEVFNNLLDVLENVKNTHRVTANALQSEYDKAHKKCQDFSEKHPEADLSISSVSSCSTDEEIDISDCSNSNLGVGRVLNDDSAIGTCHASAHSPLSFFSFMKSSSAQDKILQQSEELKENLETRREDFINSVNFMEKKINNVVIAEMNELCNLYRDEVIGFEEPDPFQPL